MRDFSCGPLPLWALLIVHDQLGVVLNSSGECSFGRTPRRGHHPFDTSSETSPESGRRSGLTDHSHGPGRDIFLPRNDQGEKGRLPYSRSSILSYLSSLYQHDTLRE